MEVGVVVLVLFFSQFQNQDVAGSRYQAPNTKYVLWPCITCFCCTFTGTCKAIVDEVDPCDCTDNYSGRICEYEESSVPTCNLQCQNEGSCRYGIKEENQTLVVNEPTGAQEHNVLIVHKNFMYCECPSGYSGVYCENKETLCGDIKCMHGSSCITVTNKDTGEIDHHCDCADINQQKLDKGENVQFAG